MSTRDRTPNGTSRTAQRGRVADRLYGLMIDLFGVQPPLRIVGWDGSSAGVSDGPVIRVNSRRAVRRIMWAPGELGLARAFVAGEIDVDGDLTEAMRALVEFGQVARAKAQLEPGDRREVLRTAVLLGAVGPAPKAPVEETGAGPAGRVEGRASLATVDDTDLVRDLFGDSLSMSCGWWKKKTADLDAAQDEKLGRVCRMLRLEPGQRLLDVGCGWGGLSLYAAEKHGVEVVGIGRSTDRVEFVRDLAAARGLSDRVEVRLAGITEVEDGPYDAIVDLESLEPGGTPEGGAYAEALERLLRGGGRLLRQQVTAIGAADDQETFMRSYVQPDGPLTPLSHTIAAWEAAGLEVRDIRSLREHYPRTLQEWAQRLEQHWDRVCAAMGEQQARVWRLSLALTTVGFERNRISVYQALAVRPKVDGSAALPPEPGVEAVPDGTEPPAATTGLHPPAEDPAA